ncbi:hypothetical protein [Nocardioides sp. R-C-SC26]|uniref:hypothetical protein n=1 Tax=Nocardioides sp. R-C-SC26 TaxID=2870414 RepID=UPI001E3CCD31|nr:hypothetical protein [Nocardioides sp. R-C-SC26]
MRDSLVPAVQAIDMTAAAGLISAWLFAEYVGACNGLRGAPLARHAASLAVDEALSPRETWMRMIWVCDLGWEPPLVNLPIFDRYGRLIGVPDLLDPIRGIVGEYDGAVHRERERHRRDLERATRFRDAGLEVVTAVAGDTRAVVIDRLARARARVERAQASSDGSAPGWTTRAPPSSMPARCELTQRLEAAGLGQALTARL